MRIAIAGMGVAGSYLAAMLGNHHDVVGYELKDEGQFDSICAWGTSKHGIAQFVRDCGLNFDDYILHEGRMMKVDLGSEIIDIKLKGLCTFDKPRLIKDMCRDQRIHFGKDASMLTLEGEYDLVIDATGVYRALLPKVEGDMWLPCLQYKVKYDDPPYWDFHIKPFQGLTGYRWYFPLGGGYAHVGAGDYYKRHVEELAAFLKAYPCEVLNKRGKPIRITPPVHCQPFYTKRVVGVGESIGSIFPLLGEGVIPSLQCATLLVKYLDQLPKYRLSVLKKFRVYNDAFKIIKAKIDRRFHLSNLFLELMLVLHHLRKNQSRYGLEVKIPVFAKIIKK